MAKIHKKELKHKLIRVQKILERAAHTLSMKLWALGIFWNFLIRMFYLYSEMTEPEVGIVI